MRLTLATGILLAAIPAASFAQSRKTFDSPEDAAEAAIQAAEQNDTANLTALFGPNPRALVSSGNPQQDQQERAEFAKLAHAKHRLEKDSMNPDRMILCIGSQDWPFPIPIVKVGDKWSFDTTQGARELRARRIGANELDAIDICAGYVQAQRQFAEKSRDKHGMQEYAQRLMGSSDALYSEGGSANLVPKPFAQSQSGDTPKPYHGYYFRVLKAQGPNAPGGSHNYLVKDSMIGGFGLIAWPAQYGTSGVHTFIVNQDGIIYEKDLHGQSTQITRYDPDKTWKPVD